MPSRKFHTHRYPWSLRAITWLVIATQLIVPFWGAMPALAQSAFVPGATLDPRGVVAPNPIFTPQNVVVNRTIPQVQPPSLTPVFSLNTTDFEIFRSGVFIEPLVPMSEPTSATENRALADALLAFHDRKHPDDVSSVLQFLNQHPTSSWRVSLLVNLGLIYRKTGYFSRALDAGEEAWSLSKNENGRKAQAMADRALGELAELNARLGRFERLEPLLAEIEGRNIRGSVTEQITGAREGFSAMNDRPGMAFRCGPFALARIRDYQNPGTNYSATIQAAQSTRQGFSFTQVGALAKAAGMDFQLVKRTAGSALILPAVVHWKVGHFAALIKENDGMLLIKDPTFGSDLWISRNALEEESSGYFSIPEGPLLNGWEKVTPEEGQTVWGKGQTSGGDPDLTAPCDPKGGGYGSGGGSGSPCKGMPEYSFHALLASLNIADIPVGYTPPLGPAVNFTVTYNQREAGQPANFAYSNLGQKWTFDWIAYVTDEPLNTNANVRYFNQGGGSHTFTNLGAQVFGTQLQSRTRLVQTSSNSYERTFPDASKQVFDLPTTATSARKIFMTKYLDPQGNALTYTYDSNFRLVSVTDALGQVTTLSYDLVADTLKITKVTDPFGRYATFEYNGSGQVTNITDVIGMSSAFIYGSGDFITSLKTPYGTTTFAKGENGIDRWIQATDPLGQTERMEYRDLDYSGLADGEPIAPNGLSVANAYLRYRNSFFWDKRAMQEFPNDVTKAKIYHWLHYSMSSYASGILESEKNPLEARVWYNYPGQSSAIYAGSTVYRSAAGRVLDDGTTQLYKFEHNDLGKMTKLTDPMGRITTNVYSTNLVDLFEVRQIVGATNELLASFTYTTNHLPVTATDASGQSASFSFNSYGQLLSVTNAKNETVTFAYGTNNYLTNITGSVSNATTSFTYDGYGRLRTATDSEAYTLTYDYDALDRVTVITYPDSTYEQIVYHKLDPVMNRDRRGRLSSTLYNPIRQVVAISDALGRITALDWCSCGALSSLTDPLGRTTTWSRDLQGRATQKIYSDGTQIAYVYEANSSRLKEVTDAKGQTTQYKYFTDDNLKQISYTNTLISTPTISLTYDTNYNRLLTTLDGIGTTTYAYYAVTNGQLGAGQLASVDGPLSNDAVTYNYDQLGRVTSRAINGVAVRLSYDSLGRMTTITNVLGAFTNNYINTTERLSSVAYPNGQTTSFNYFSNTNDERLQTIWNQNASAATISKFDYTYDAEGQIQSWTQQADTNQAAVYQIGYDTVDQLTSAILSSQSSVLKSFYYGYDSAGNRRSEQIDMGIAQAGFNNVNQLLSRSGGGSLSFKGSISEPGTVTVGGTPATMTSATNFVGWVDTLVGTNVVPTVATDYSGNSRTNNYQIVVTNGLVAKTLTYDLNGNLSAVVTSTATNTYEWDAADRLVAINRGTNRSEFTYDGGGRRVRIVEKQSGSTVSDKRFVWCGTELCEERDSTGGTVNRRFFGQGEQISGTNYFFTRDHLGSVREIVDSSGTVGARFDYDPYGRRTKVSGSFESDFGFTGHYCHAVSELYLTLFRAYDADTARWLNRDPIQEYGGINLYAYVRNQPLARVDSWGLADCDALKNAIQRGYATFQRDSQILGNTLRDQRAALTQLFIVDRSVDAALSVGGAAAGEFIAAKIVAKGATLMHGESLGTSLVRSGAFSGPGLSQVTSFVTFVGVGGAVAGRAIGYGIEFGVHIVGENVLHHSPLTTEGVRESFNETVNSLNESLDQLRKHLSKLRATFRANCKW
jgi:RHS repeat-associated protein